MQVWFYSLGSGYGEVALHLVNDLSDLLRNSVFKSKYFLNVRLVFTADIELSEILGIFRILSVVFVVDLPD